MSAPTVASRPRPRPATLRDSRVVAALPDEVFRLVADVTNWPLLFPSVVYARVQRGAATDRIRTWVRAGDTVVERTAWRTLDRSALRMTFAAGPGAGGADPGGPATSGEWSFALRPGGRTEVRLERRVRRGPDGPPDAAVAAAAGELAALERIAAQPGAPEAALLAFADVVPLPDAAGTADAYGLVAAADRWPALLPHVDRVDLVTGRPARAGGALVQDMTMDTRTGDGGRHTTRSIRLCFPPERIVYTQLRPPALLLGHHGAWDFVDAGHGPARVVAAHKVAIDTTRIAELLGSATTIADARAWLREVLGANSRATLGAVARHAAGAST